MNQSQPPFRAGSRIISPGQPVFVICEGGVTNYGDLELAKRQVDAAAAARADIVKFQVTNTEALISRKVAKRLAPELGFDWFERVKYKELSLEALADLARYARTAGYPFFATAHEEESLDLLLREFDPPFLKIGSGEAGNIDFLKRVGAAKKPIMISFGLQSDDEVVRAIDTLSQAGAGPMIALHCTTLYPTPYDAIDLTRMRRIGELTGLPVGISDHSVGWQVVLAAVALGACVVEKHLTFDKDDPRSLDNPGALLPAEFKLMVRQIRDVEAALRPVPDAERLRRLETGRNWASQAIVARRDIAAGMAITRDMIAFKRPGKGGLAPAMADRIVGKTARVMIEADEQILESHVH